MGGAIITPYPQLHYCLQTYTHVTKEKKSMIILLTFIGTFGELDALALSSRRPVRWS